MTHKLRRHKVRVSFRTLHEENQVASPCLLVSHFQPGLVSVDLANRQPTRHYRRNFSLYIDIKTDSNSKVISEKSLQKNTNTSIKNITCGYNHKIGSFVESKNTAAVVECLTLCHP